MTNTIDRGEVFNAFVKPFIDLVPYVLDNPLSKKLPKGFRVTRESKRQGDYTIFIYCNNFQALMEGYSHLLSQITDDENKEIEKVFILRDELINKGLI